MFKALLLTACLGLPTPLMTQGLPDLFADP